ncbi:MAG: hypothetical protein HEEMFOPI_01985 [Holosporales bacterium]
MKKGATAQSKKNFFSDLCFSSKGTVNDFFFSLTKLRGGFCLFFNSCIAISG